jgi:hypothetical protein
MSKKHSELLQLYNNTEVANITLTKIVTLTIYPITMHNCTLTLSHTKAGKERIWRIARDVWNTCTSSMVCRAFILAYRILGKIVETKGDTDWLKNGTPHCNVRRDFFDTEVGVKPLKNVIEVESEGSMTEQESSISY